jgi:DNA-binding NtrC family response regulator
VRELENLMERACLLARGETIRLEDLHLSLSAASAAGASPTATIIDLDRPITLDEMERRLIVATLERTGGNRTRTADLLGVSVRTVRNKLNQYGLSQMAVS